MLFQWGINVKKRFFDKKPSLLKGTDYDSLLEMDLHNGVLKGIEHHPEKIPYVSEHFYTPDFKFENIYIEVKGRFQDTSEASKYKWVRKALPPGKELVFLFANPHLPFPFSKIRKDGTKMTHGEWATLNNFRWFTQETIGGLIGRTTGDS